MPRKRPVFVHVGLDHDSHHVIDAALDVHAHALLELGVRRERAGHDRDDLRRRAARGRDTIVVSEPSTSSMSVDDVRSLAATLGQLEVHAVVTVSSDLTDDLVRVLDRWSRALGAPERVHVLVCDEPTRTWRDFGRVVGFGTASLRVPLLAPA